MWPIKQRKVTTKLPKISSLIDKIDKFHMSWCLKIKKISTYKCYESIKVLPWQSNHPWVDNCVSWQLAPSLKCWTAYPLVPPYHRTHRFVMMTAVPRSHQLVTFDDDYQTSLPAYCSTYHPATMLPPMVGSFCWWSSHAGTRTSLLWSMRRAWTVRWPFYCFCYQFRLSITINKDVKYLRFDCGMP